MSSPTSGFQAEPVEADEAIGILDEWDGMNRNRATRGRGRRASLRSGAIAFASIALFACGDSAPFEDRHTDKSRPPNIVLIIVDTLRADHLGIYGSRRDTSPKIDALAASAVLYQRAYSQAPWTTASIGSLLTSRYPATLAIGDLDAPLPEESMLLPEVLQAAGYSTGAIVSHRLCGSRWGFNQGYDVFDERQIAGHDGISSGGITDSAIEFVEAHRVDPDDQDPSLINPERTGPFFLLLHYFDPHFSYIEHEPFEFLSEEPSYRGWIQSGVKPKQVAPRIGSLKPADLRELLRLYDSEIAFTDHHIGRFLDFLRASDLFESSMIVLTADHGEEFLDHGGVSHSNTLFDEVVRVPLIVKYPFGAHSTVEHPVALLDIFPTVLDIAGVPVPAGARGRSLRSPAGDSFRPVFTDVARGRRKPLHAVVDHPWKLIYDVDENAHALYDLTTDPGERRDLASKEPERVRALALILDRWISSNRPVDAHERVVLEKDDVLQLRELGYLD